MAQHAAKSAWAGPSLRVCYHPCNPGRFKAIERELKFPILELTGDEVSALSLCDTHESSRMSVASAKITDAQTIQRTFWAIQSMYSRLPVASRLKISLVGSNHFSFSDQILLKSQLLQGAMRAMHAIGRLDGRRGLEITAD